ncbi:MAG: imidazole glycerol phosphate synthase subunit HisH [Candidatus Spyradocola sp.]|jgi:glutamine amidotransferase
MIAVVDYGAGNVCSVMHALEHIGAPSILTRDAGEIARADAVILPGVGAFGDAMEQLGSSGTITAMERFLETGRPFLGICIGEQLLFERSEESPGSRGLSWLRGSVRRIPAGPGRKVPHMGWNEIEICQKDPLFAGLPEKPYFYFVHSYYVQAQDPSCVLARVRYGVDMDVAVRRNNLYAVQFHPEKSGACGLQLLQNFAAMR